MAPLPITPSPSPGRNMPGLEVCLQMGETEAQVNGAAVSGPQWLLKIQQPIPCLWALCWMGSLRGGEGWLTRLVPAGVTFLLGTCLVLFCPPLCFCLLLEG